MNLMALRFHSFSGPFLIWWLFFVLSPAQMGGPPSENVHQPADDTIADQTPEPGGKILVFPDYVDGGGWSVQLVISNVDPEAAAEVRVDVYDPDRQPVLDLFDSDLTLKIPGLGSRVLRSGGSGAIRRGWIQAETDSASVSGLLTYRHAQSGVEVGVNPVELGPQFALFVEETPTVGAGVAVFKPDASSRLELRIRDEEGDDPLEGGFAPWEDFYQTARTLPEWFAVEGADTGFLADFRGLLFLETEDESPFAPLGLRFGKGTSSLSAVPAIRTQGEELRETNLVFPDYVDGGGWSVQLVLSNVDPEAATEVEVEVYDPDGQPAPDLFDFDLTLEIPALGSRVLRSAGVGAIRRGRIEVEADSVAVSGLLTYRHVQTGIEVGVEPARLGKEFALFVEESGTVGAGLALFKPEAESRIELRLRDEAGKDPLNGLFVPWRDFHQAARTLPEWFDVEGVDTEFLRDLRGLLFLRTEDESGFAPLGLRFGKRTSSLSAVPAIRIPDGGGIDGGHPPPPTVTLSASPTSIDRGQSTTLTWSSRNAESAEITPDIGMVPTSGSRKVSPNVTTTYRITVTGADGQTATASVTVTVADPERVALGALFDALGGSGWTRSDNWLTATPLGEWYGVEVDSQGRVIGLRMAEWVETENRTVGNGLTGEIPAELGSLTYLRVLDLSRNQLEGEIPAELGRLSNLIRLDLNWNRLEGEIPAELGQLFQLQQLDLRRNQLTGPIPPELGQLSQLQQLDLTGNNLTGAIPAELGGLDRLEYLGLTGNNLTGAIPAELGDLSSLTFLALGANALEGPIPPELGRLTSVERFLLWGNNLTGPIPPEVGNLAKAWILSVSANNLSGPIPPELGNLANMERLELSGNALNSVIPPELGNLANLEILWLGFNELTGPIPPELGGLELLETLSLSQNNLTGPIPPELGGLASLKDLYLGENNLTGRIPPELQNLSILEELNITNNDLTGTLPPEIGGIATLRELVLTNNSGMAGPLPSDLTALDQLNVLLAGGTDLCAPSNSRFKTWLSEVHKRRISPCFEEEPPMAYLAQAVQSREFPVPLVAGEKALLRVFPTAGAVTSQGIPAVRARFYRDGLETHVENIPGKNAPIPTQVNEGNLSISANAEIPAAVIQPGLEMVIEVDPERMLDPGLGVTRRIPKEGRLAVDVRTMPLFDLTLIPFLWSQDPDSSIVDLVEVMAEDAEGHEMLWHTRTLLPIGELEVTAHEPVLSTSNNAFDLRANAQAIRAMEGGTGYYMGLMPPPVMGAAGVGFIATRVSFSIPNATTIAHELGHNLSLYHAPCGGAGDPDPSYPQTDGSIGAWGYDFREGGQLVRPARPDLMTYCGPYWISDYHFTNALRYRLNTAGGGQSSLVAAPGKSLLLWGGVDAVGPPFLEPAFIVQAPASLPRSTGDYEIVGRTADREELFSLHFQMPVVAEGDGRSSFAFVLPVQPEWTDQLVSITLSGPGGSVTLDQDTDSPVTLLRNPRSGQVRAILRGAEATPPNLDATVSALSLDPALERLTSRGIPDPEDWTQ